MFSLQHQRTLVLRKIKTSQHERFFHRFPIESLGVCFQKNPSRLLNNVERQSLSSSGVGRVKSKSREDAEGWKTIRTRMSAHITGTVGENHC